MLAVGDLVGGRYRLVHRIAGGGMGEVWCARDERLDREVALKALRAEHADDETFQTRFQLEAKCAASLHSDHVVGVYDWGEQTDDAGRHMSYLVMEYVAGGTVASEISARGRISPERTKVILRGAATGLAAAHARGYVHRDVKPANLLLDEDGEIKVADFGIARAAASAALTATGLLVGTATYLAPEQVKGQSAVAASDIYALGVVAYQCLTGQPPFVGDSDVTIALARLNAPVPSLPAETPADLRDLVTAMLHADPEQRPTAAEVAGRAAAWRREAPPTTAIGMPGVVGAGAAAAAAETGVLAAGASSPLVPAQSDHSWRVGRRGVFAAAASMLVACGVLLPILFGGSPAASDAAARAATLKPKPSPAAHVTRTTHRAVHHTRHTSPPTRAAAVTVVRHAHKPPPAKPSKQPKPTPPQKPTHGPKPGHGPGKKLHGHDKP